MSGTSLDGVDAVLLEMSGAQCRVLAHSYQPFNPGLRQELLRLNTPGSNELHRAARAANQLVLAYADLVRHLMSCAGLKPHQVRAIGAHGQTVRHHPQALDEAAAPDVLSEIPTPGYTLQLNNPALLAELTGITVVADFRSRDVAAGGQGAPLVPAFHLAMFGRRHEAVAVLNLGGMANISLLAPTDDTPSQVMGFDCGPGNVLMDLWCQQTLGQAYDAGGAWAATGSVNAALLSHLLDEPFFALPAPKSTGRDLFSEAWLNQKLTRFQQLSPADVQATLAQLTAHTCAQSLATSNMQFAAMLVCGGGALNPYLINLLQNSLPKMQVISTESVGLPPMQVEAAAFAWLASKTLAGESGNVPGVTGARGARVLGAIYPA